MAVSVPRVGEVLTEPETLGARPVEVAVPLVVDAVEEAATVGAEPVLVRVPLVGEAAAELETVGADPVVVRVPRVVFPVKSIAPPVDTVGANPVIVVAPAVGVRVTDTLAASKSWSSRTRSAFLPLGVKAPVKFTALTNGKPKELAICDDEL